MKRHPLKSDENSWSYTVLKIESRFHDRQILAIFCGKFSRKSDAEYVHLCESSDKMIGFICGKQKRYLRKQFHCRIQAKENIALSFSDLFQEIYQMCSESVILTL